MTELQHKLTKPCRLVRVTLGAADAARAIPPPWCWMTELYEDRHQIRDYVSRVLRHALLVHRCSRSTDCYSRSLSSHATMAAPVDTFVIGNICTDCKASARADQGDAAVVSAVDRKEAGNTATIYVFADGEDATAASKHFIAVDNGLTHDGANDVLDTDGLSSLLGRSRRKLDGATKNSFSSTFSENWRSLFATPTARRRAVPPAPHDPLVGETVNVVQAMQYNGDGAATADPLYSGQAKVVRPHAVVPDVYVLSIDAPGGAAPVVRYVFVTKPTLVALVAAAKTADVVVPHRFHGLLAYQIAKGMPGTADALGLDAAEFITMCSHAGLDVEGVAYDSAGVALAFAGWIRELQAMLDRRSGAAAQTWPSDPKRLGLAVKRFAAQSAPTPSPAGAAPMAPAPPQFPLSESLKTALSKQMPTDGDAVAALAEIRAFVADICTVAATKRHIIEDDYCASGAIEGFLRSGLQSAESIARADLSGLGQVKWFCSQVKQTIDDKPTAPARAPHSMLPVINVHTPGGGAPSEEDTRLRSVLRGDATAVMADNAALDSLAKLKRLADADAGEALRDAVGNETHAPLHRLCTSGEVVDRALAGAL